MKAFSRKIEQMKWMKFLAVTALVAACYGPVDTSLLSTTPASQVDFANAKAAASICAQHAPNWRAAETALVAKGFSETTDVRLREIQTRQKAAILQNDQSDVVVLLGSRGGEGACIVGLENMTPQQSYELALPWVRKYQALTNAERGQGLAKNMVQAWGRLEEDRIVFIAAYKTWDVLGKPGAAARLIYIQK